MVFVCFFFQAEDGIRDWSVTGVQTCALPILMPAKSLKQIGPRGMEQVVALQIQRIHQRKRGSGPLQLTDGNGAVERHDRSEERRVGKEWRSRGVPSH